MNRESRTACPICGKKVKQLSRHFGFSHPDADPRDLGVEPGFRPDPEPIATGRVHTPEGISAAGGQQTPAPGPPARSPDRAPYEYEAIIASLAAANAELQATVNGMVRQVQAMAEDQDQFQRSVVSELNKVPQLAQAAATSMLDQMAADIQRRVPAMAAQVQAAQSAVEGPAEALPEPAPRSNGRAGMGGLMESLLPLLLQKFLAPTPPAGGSELLARMQEYQAISTVLTAPLLQGVELATKFMQAGSRAGLTPEQIAAGNAAVADTMRPRPSG